MAKIGAYRKFISLLYATVMEKQYSILLLFLTYNGIFALYVAMTTFSANIYYKKFDLRKYDENKVDITSKMNCSNFNIKYSNEKRSFLIKK